MASPQKRPAVFTTVDQLRPGTRNHNLRIKVLDSKLVLNRPRGDGSSVRIAECLVGDETGVILFSARNEQVDQLAVGSYVTLRNAKIDMFKGSMRLAVDEWGRVDTEDDELSSLKFEPKKDNNLSLVEYEVVVVSARADDTAAAS